MLGSLCAETIDYILRDVSRKIDNEVHYYSRQINVHAVYSIQAVHFARFFYVSLRRPHPMVLCFLCFAWFFDSKDISEIVYHLT